MPRRISLEGCLNSSDCVFLSHKAETTQEMSSSSSSFLRPRIFCEDSSNSVQKSRVGMLKTSWRAPSAVSWEAEGPASFLGAAPSAVFA